MKKLTILFVTLVTLFTFAPSSTASTKVMWDGMELKKGQIGRITVLESNPLIKLEFAENGLLDTYEITRYLPVGGVYRVYGTKNIQGYPPMYNVGGGYYVLQSEPVYNYGHLKYETPSKAKLALVNGK